jgi:hypothetical protein
MEPLDAATTSLRVPIEDTLDGAKDFFAPSDDTVVTVLWDPAPEANVPLEEAVERELIVESWLLLPGMPNDGRGARTRDVTLEVTLAVG